MTFPVLTMYRGLLALALAAQFAAALAANTPAQPSTQLAVEVEEQPEPSASAQPLSASSPASASVSAPGESSSGHPVRIETSKRGAALELYAVNDGFAPVSVTIELTKAKNTGFSPNVIGTNASHLIPPHSRKLITMAVPLKKGRPMEFAYIHRFAFGDNLAELSQGYKYRLPIPDGTTAVLRAFSALPYKSNFFTTAHAAELLAPPGTPVVVARPGVVFLASDISQHPPSRDGGTLGNHVAVLHDDGSWAVYASLQSGSVKVKPGDRVEVSQQIAVIGRNPTSADTFLIFGVVRAVGGLTVATIPFLFTSKAVEEINPTLFAGPVSPDLRIKYPPPVSEDPWHPPETVLPTPPVITNYGDEDLTPLQRQNLYRQRVVDHANAGRETVGDSTTLVFLGGVAVALSFVAFGLSLLNSGKGANTGARGWLWSLIHGSQPTGTLSFDPSDAKPPVVGPVVAQASQENAALAKEAQNPATLAGDPNSQESVPDDKARAQPAPNQRLHDPVTLELIRHMSHSTPLGLLSTHGVPASAVVESASPTETIDFVLIRASDASVVLIVLRAENHYLAHTMALAGVPHVVLPQTPTAEQVRASVQSALQSSSAPRLPA